MADTYHAVASPVDDAGERKIEQHPLETTNWINYITISWLDKLVRKGSKVPLTAEDIWPLARADRTEVLYSHVSQSWKAHGDNPKLHVVLWHTFRGRILVAVVPFTLYGAFGLVQPIAVKSMLQFLQADGDSIETDLGIENGYILALVLFVVTLVSVSMMDFAGYYGTHLGVNVKTALSHMVYRKTLSLSSKAKAFSSGEVITMSSVDLDRIALAFGVGQWAFVSPVMLTAIYIMLGFQLTALAAFAGAIVMAIFIYFGFATGDTIGKLRQDMLAIQAERVKLTNEVLQGVRVVKLYAWEDSMHRLLQEIRLRELQALKRYFNLFMINNVLLIVAPVASLASALLVYVARGHPLTVPVAFTALAYINLAKQPCGVFSIAIVATMDALASCRRLSNFFNSTTTSLLQATPPTTHHSRPFLQ
ncbi:unnamed protein product [Aphanomyces euteiches]